MTIPSATPCTTRICSSLRWSKKQREDNDRWKDGSCVGSGKRMAVLNQLKAFNWSRQIKSIIKRVTSIYIYFCLFIFILQCGIVLGTILLFFCSWLTLSSCQMLMKAGLSSRKRSYGFLGILSLQSAIQPTLINF